ncbi:MAG: YwiC-like family protein [Chloroflexota bacterium]
MDTPSRLTPRQVNLRSIALPAEHGSWGFWLEAVLLGLLLAPTFNGVLFSLAALALMLLHQPLKIALKDVIKKRQSPRRAAAVQFAALYGLVGGVLLLIVLIQSPALLLVPLALAGALIGVQIIYDLRGRSRHMVAELCGSVALGSIAAAVAIIGSRALPFALGLWLALALRTITSVVYARSKLRLERGKPHTPITAGWWHLAAGLTAAVLAWADALPWTVLIGVILLSVRTLHGLYRPEGIKPKVVGIREMVIGVGYALLVALGYTI